MTRRTQVQEIVTGYSGPFSSYPEWHAFGVGFYYGARTKYSRIPSDLQNLEMDRYNEAVDQEFHYATLGFEVGDWYRRHRKKVYGGVAVGTFIGIIQGIGGIYRVG